MTERTVARTYWQLAATTLVVAAATLGCSKSPTSPTQPQATNFTLILDGVSRPITAGTAVRNNPGFPGVTVSCVVNDNDTGIGFNIAIPEGTGVYTVGPGQNISGTMEVRSGSTAVSYLSYDTIGSGTVTVTALSSTMITGSFDLQLGVDPVLVPTPAVVTHHAVGTFNVVIGS